MLIFDIRSLLAIGICAKRHFRMNFVVYFSFLKLFDYKLVSIIKRSGLKLISLKFEEV